MKKLFFILVSASMLLAISNSAYASSEPQKQSAKEKRELRKAAQAAADSAYAKIIEEAVKDGSFSFTADYFSFGSIARQSLNSGYHTMFVTPQYLNVRLPYLTSTRPVATTPLTIDFQTAEFKYSSEFVKDSYYVKITVNGVQNKQSNLKVQNGTYIFDFQIGLSGSTILTITPNYMAPITFYGSISAKQ